MTSAARPTWSAALGSGGGLRDGSSAAPTLQTCAKDQRGHLTLKLRQPGQNAPEEMQKRNLRQTPVGLITGDSDEDLDDSEDEKLPAQRESGKSDHEGDNENEKDLATDSEAEMDPDDSDEEAELLRELDKIRQEREAERVARERRAAEQDPHAVLAGNPLLATPSDAGSTASFAVKRRWDDDVVFKNQAKSLEDKPQRRFINDTTRSDFHRRFLDKYIK